MKKFLSLFLTFALLWGLFGCQSQEAPSQPEPEAGSNAGAFLDVTTLPQVRVFVDISSGFDAAPNNIRALGRNLPGSDRDFHYVIESPPNSDPERDNYLTNLRVEMMAGKGPDVFFVNTFQGFFMDKKSSILFPFPEKAMENRLFLPLDDYIANAKYMEWEKMVPVMMEAGRGTEGQVLLPMEYDFDATCYDMELFELPEDIPTTRKGLKESGNLLLEFAVEPDMLRPLAIFGMGADFKNEELTFTEEELLEVMVEFSQWDEKWQADGYYSALYGPDKTGRAFGNISYLGPWTSGRSNIMVIPKYNQEDGITMYLTEFAAVNINSQYPEWAFLLIDKVLSPEGQRTSYIYETGHSPQQVATASPLLDETLEKVNAVKFFSALDGEAYNTITEVCRGDDVTREELERAAHKLYTTLKMMLAES